MTYAPALLELNVPTRPLRYQVRTATAVQVGQMQFENELLYAADLTLRARHAGGYVLQIDVQNAMQKAEDLFSRVSADVNRVSRTLVVQTDLYGNLLRVENHSDVVRHWEQLYPTLRRKYAAESAVQPFLDAFDQQLRQPGSLEANLQHKGLYGALLTGLYGHTYGSAPVADQRCIKGFFNTLDLPLRLRATSQPLAAGQAPMFPNAVRLGVTGELDDEVFTADEFRRLIRSIVDDYKFPVDLQVHYAADHVLDAPSGMLLTSQQVLKAEVPGVYHNSITHHVLYQQSPV